VTRSTGLGVLEPFARELHDVLVEQRDCGRSEMVKSPGGWVGVVLPRRDLAHDEGEVSLGRGISLTDVAQCCAGDGSPGFEERRRSPGESSRALRR
jgi:hypothetical protein